MSRYPIVGRSIISTVLLVVVCLVYVDRGLSRCATRDGDHMTIFIKVLYLGLESGSQDSNSQCIINRESGCRKDSRTRTALSLMY